MVRADPETDGGDPREVLTHYNRDPSWDEEIRQFASSIIEDLPIVSGTAADALETMKLVYRIYYADPAWRTAYSISNPDRD